ncbi:HAD-IC family P-type ATPase, partial [Amycolatopsis sp. H20-H5]|uniref:HAD-IC family P-type ATPase n=1 Tax=Amycolatopsis sp. H20-H5 TaxID=3046309 RepID=UPI002DB6FD18
MSTAVPVAPAATGLTGAEAASILRRDGRNELPPPAQPHPLGMLLKQMVQFFALMLWVAAGLAVIAGMPVLAIAIAVVVLVNGGFSFAQEYRADRAADRLRDLIPTRATVRRDDLVVVVEATDLVVGDVIVLEAGDRVCADAELVAGTRLSVNESLLTGESKPVRGTAGTPIHAGTYVVDGHGSATVTATGARTRLAGIATVTEQAKRPRSPLTTQLHRVVRVIAIVAIVVGLIFFGTALLLGFSPNEGFLFAIGVTVALVPDGLLPTVTLSLARAVQKMAKHNALVRRPESVETLGATTFICTDKTGTLTRNEMAVVTVWTPGGSTTVSGTGYHPEGSLSGSAEVVRLTSAVADSAARCSPDSRAQHKDGRWAAVGDPMEVALHVLAARAKVPAPPAPLARNPFDAHRRRASLVDKDGVH